MNTNISVMSKINLIIIIIIIIIITTLKIIGKAKIIQERDTISD